MLPGRNASSEVCILPIIAAGRESGTEEHKNQNGKLREGSIPFPGIRTNKLAVFDIKLTKSEIPRLTVFQKNRSPEGMPAGSRG